MAEKLRPRTATMKKYDDRKSTLLRKSMELSVLCGIDVCFLVVSPDGKLETWPENLTDVKKVLHRLNSPHRKIKKVSFQNVVVPGGENVGIKIGPVVRDQEILRNDVVFGSKIENVNKIGPVIPDQEIPLKTEEFNYQIGPIMQNQELPRNDVVFRSEIGVSSYPMHNPISEDFLDAQHEIFSDLEIAAILRDTEAGWDSISMLERI